MVVVVMGVSGAGKSTIGRLLAPQLGCPFFDGDDFHAPESVAKMRRGEPLTDADRAGWLDRLHDLIASQVQAGTDAVLACSALTNAYRARLGLPCSDVRLVFLRGDEALLRERLRARTGHFVHDELLTSQLALLETPADAIVVDVAATPAEQVAQIRRALGR